MLMLSHYGFQLRRIVRLRPRAYAAVGGDCDSLGYSVAGESVPGACGRPRVRPLASRKRLATSCGSRVLGAAGSASVGTTTEPSTSPLGELKMICSSPSARTSVAAPDILSIRSEVGTAACEAHRLQPLSANKALTVLEAGCCQRSDRHRILDRQGTAWPLAPDLAHYSPERCAPGNQRGSSLVTCSAM